jgi:hypothetical protein
MPENGPGLRSAGHQEIAQSGTASVVSSPSSSAVTRYQFLPIKPSTTLLNSDGFSNSSPCEVFASITFSSLIKQGSILLIIEERNDGDLSPPSNNTGQFNFLRSLQVVGGIMFPRVILALTSCVFIIIISRSYWDNLEKYALLAITTDIKWITAFSSSLFENASTTFENGFTSFAEGGGNHFQYFSYHTSVLNKW